MKLIVVFAQRKCAYPGQYEPEALACATEFEDSDNPDYLAQELQKAFASNDFASVKRVEVKIDGARLVEILTPKAPTLDGALDVA